MNKVLLDVANLKSEVVLDADPVELKAWLILITNCTIAENGGRLRGAVKWSDEEWAMRAGVPGAVMRKKSALWSSERNDILVRFYSGKAERTYRAICDRNLAAIESRWKKDAKKLNGHSVSL